MGFSFFKSEIYESEIYESEIWRWWAGLIAVLFGVCLPVGTVTSGWILGFIFNSLEFDYFLYGTVYSG